jgi:hypothetical protein
MLIEWAAFRFTQNFKFGNSGFKFWVLKNDTRDTSDNKSISHFLNDRLLLTPCDANHPTRLTCGLAERSGCSRSTWTTDVVQLQQCIHHLCV